MNKYKLCKIKNKKKNRKKIKEVINMKEKNHK